MSKTIKVIDLLNKIANGEEVPKKIKINGNIYHYCESCAVYESENEIDLDFKTNFYVLTDEVEIIEAEPEIDIQGIREITSFGIKQNQDGINLLIRAVKQLDNQINNK